MSVRRVDPGPCWGVPSGEEWDAHHTGRAEAITTAADHMPDNGPIPVVTRHLGWCWQLVWPCCGEFQDDGEDAPGSHYSLAMAEELDRQLGGHQMCDMCSSAALYGSVAAANGGILPGAPPPAPRSIRQHPDQLALPLPGPEQQK